MKEKMDTRKAVASALGVVEKKLTERSQMWKRAVCATAYAALEYYGDEPRFLDVMRTAKVYAEREVEAGHCAEIVWELMENHGGGVSDPDPAFDPKYCVGVVKGRAS